MHNPVIYKEIGINIVFPTTSVFDHSSFPKEEIRDRIDFLVSPGLGIIDFCTFSFLLHNRKDGFHLSPNGWFVCCL